QPEGPFGTVTAARPGEWTQIDSTPLDVRVVHDDGTVDRVELTGLVDQATRTIAAAVLRPTTKAVDAALLLARALTPEPMRPGWADALRLTRSVLPYQSLTAIDERLGPAPAGGCPGDDRVRSRQGLPVGDVPVGLPVAGHQPGPGAPAHPNRQGDLRAHPGVGGDAVRPVHSRLRRFQRGAPRQERRGRRGVVDGR